MKYLLKVEETYRVDNENEAAQLIKEAQQDNRFTVAKSASVHREKKQKGEVVDDWTRVTITKVFTDEKEPESQVEVNYDITEAFNLE